MANLHVTTTGLRINIETISAEKLEDGKITLAQAQGMSRLIGHSEATKRRCYVLQDTYRSVVNTVQAERAVGIRFSGDNRDDGLLNSGDYTNDLDNDNTTYNDTDTDNNNNFHKVDLSRFPAEFSLSSSVKECLPVRLQGNGKQPHPSYLCAATNRIDIIDPALLRSGRFDLMFEVPLPELMTREKIFCST